MTVTRPDPPHSEMACWSLAREQIHVETIACFTIPGEPASKARPRFDGRGIKSRTYTPAKTKEAETAVGWAFRAAAHGHRPDSTHQYGVFAIFFAGTNQRRDVDNMIKLVCDGLNKIAWADDSQVVEVSGRRGLDLPENARTEVWVYRLGEIPKPVTRTCKQCKKRFRTYPSWGDRPYCSRACFGLAQRDRNEVACAHCGKSFEVKASRDARFCSVGCKRESGKISIICEVCGEEYRIAQSVAARRVSICNPCRRKAVER